MGIEQYRKPNDFNLKNLTTEPLFENLTDEEKIKRKAEKKLALAKVGIELAKLQTILFAENKRKVLIVLQGMDTSGKDGTTKAIFSQLNPLAARAVAFKKPELKELAHDFLWRVHAQVPASGELVVFNRSHYEDVLVPLVHGTIDNEECKKRYQHIVNFEKLLTDTDTIIFKFFLHISKSEQRKRIEERISDPEKQWKFDAADIQERKFWDEYQGAYEKMMNATDTENAPWHIIPSDSKSERNLVVARIILSRLEKMNLKFPEIKKELLP